jgi:penicillin-binding protein 1A
MNVTDVVNDHSVCFATASGQWCPKNYEGKFYGPVDLQTALAKSLNSVSVQIAAKVTVDEVIRTMRSLGISSPIERTLPLAVGAVELTPLEHVAAYTAIARNGRRVPSQFGNATPGIAITRVTTEGGRPLYEYQSPADEQAVSAEDAYALIHLMKGVVEFGTGKRVQELGRPAAGKTGTTNDAKGVWFMGFTADLVAGAWVGRMTPAPIAPKATGGSVALPEIWLPFMKAAHPPTPPRDFPMPLDGGAVIMPGANGHPIPFQRGHVPAQRQ